jgi:hypothetical protein
MLFLLLLLLFCPFQTKGDNKFLAVQQGTSMTVYAPHNEILQFRGIINVDEANALVDSVTRNHYLLLFTLTHSLVNSSWLFAGIGTSVVQRRLLNHGHAREITSVEPDSKLYSFYQSFTRKLHTEKGHTTFFGSPYTVLVDLDRQFDVVIHDIFNGDAKSFPDATILKFKPKVFVRHSTNAPLTRQPYSHTITVTIPPDTTHHFDRAALTHVYEISSRDITLSCSIFTGLFATENTFKGTLCI